jgi:CBS domain-containing membrane protein
MKELKVWDVMTANPTTLKLNEKLTLADDIMRLGRVRHLPVLDDDDQTLVGIVTQRDLFRNALAQALGYGRHAQRKILDTLAVKDVMATELVTIKPDAYVVEAAKLLTERKIGCLPVVENGRLVGILTEGDFVALVARESP